MELNADAATDHGYRIDPVTMWTNPPLNQWFYLYMVVVNPYPNPAVLAKLGNVDYSQLKPVTLHCAAYDAKGNLIKYVTASNPPPNTHYAALDEAYVRTWDSQNDYKVDWFYAGPPAGDPLNALVHPAPGSIQSR